MVHQMLVANEIAGLCFITKSLFNEVRESSPAVAAGTVDTSFHVLYQHIFLQTGLRIMA